MSPTTNTLGCPLTVRSDSTTTRPDRSTSVPRTARRSTPPAGWPAHRPPHLAGALHPALLTGLLVLHGDSHVVDIGDTEFPCTSTPIFSRRRCALRPSFSPIGVSRNLAHRRAASPCTRQGRWSGTPPGSVRRARARRSGRPARRRSGRRRQPRTSAAGCARPGRWSPRPPQKAP